MRQSGSACDSDRKLETARAAEGASALARLLPLARRRPKQQLLYGLPREAPSAGLCSPRTSQPARHKWPGRKPMKQHHGSLVLDRRDWPKCIPVTRGQRRRPRSPSPPSLLHARNSPTGRREDNWPPLTSELAWRRAARPLAKWPEAPVVGLRRRRRLNKWTCELWPQNIAN